MNETQAAELLRVQIQELDAVMWLIKDHCDSKGWANLCARKASLERALKERK